MFNRPAGLHSLPEQITRNVKSENLQRNHKANAKQIHDLVSCMKVIHHVVNAITGLGFFKNLFSSFLFLINSTGTRGGDTLTSFENENNSRRQKGYFKLQCGGDNLDSSAVQNRKHNSRVKSLSEIGGTRSSCRKFSQTIICASRKMIAKSPAGFNIKCMQGNYIMLLS